MGATAVTRAAFPGGGLVHVHTIGIIANYGKPEATDGAARLLAELQNRGIRVVLTPRTGEILNRPELVRPYPDGWGDLDMAMVLGGDGTLLRAAKKLAPLNPPVLGINTGHLGFLTEVESEEALTALDEVLSGRWEVEHRMMLRIRVLRAGVELYASDALNDVVITRGPLARMVHVAVEVSGTPAADYPADGVIVATPTGSTAYSLSAGGPICHPQLNVFVVTPICPHTFNSRALVVPADETVAVRIQNPGEILLTVDGQLGFEFEPDDVVLMDRSPSVARLVRRRPYRFYDVLRRKLAEPYRKIGASFGQ